jgi:hypothetical protein
VVSSQSSGSPCFYCPRRVRRSLLRVRRPFLAPCSQLPAFDSIAPVRRLYRKERTDHGRQPARIAFSIVSKPPATLLALLIGSLTFLADVGGGWYYAPWRPTLSASRAFSHAITISVLAFIIVYVAQLIFRGWWLRPDNQSLFCPRCRTVQPKRSGTHCACGEQLDLLRNWKWIPDEISPS